MKHVGEKTMYKRQAANDCFYIPKMSHFEITFSERGDRLVEAADWLPIADPCDFFMIQAPSGAPRPAGALAYRGHGFAVRRMY